MQEHQRNFMKFPRNLHNSTSVIDISDTLTTETVSQTVLTLFFDSRNKKPSKNHGNMGISKKGKKHIVFLNLLRPRKLASRAGEKQILIKKIRKKWVFQKTQISWNWAAMQARARFSWKNVKVLKILKISGMILETSRNPKQEFFFDEIIIWVSKMLKFRKIMKNSG